MPTDYAVAMAQEITRQQSACQSEIDAGWAAMRVFLEGTADADIRPYIERILIAETRMAMIPWDVEEDYRFLYGLGTPVSGLLNAR